ncbi:MAG: hypothetical protein ACLTYN_05200 [Dysosmobacter welbionis]
MLSHDHPVPGHGQGQESLVCSILRKGVLDIPLLYLMDALFPCTAVWVQPIVDAISLAAALWFYRAIQRGARRAEWPQPGLKPA